MPMGTGRTLVAVGGRWGTLRDVARIAFGTTAGALLRASSNHMLSKITTLLKQPAFWVLAIVLVIAVLAFSKLRKPFAAIAAKVPGNDVAAQ